MRPAGKPPKPKSKPPTVAYPQGQSAIGKGRFRSFTVAARIASCPCASDEKKDFSKRTHFPPLAWSRTRFCFPADGFVWLRLPPKMGSSGSSCPRQNAVTTRTVEVRGPELQKTRRIIGPAPDSRTWAHGFSRLSERKMSPGPPGPGSNSASPLHRPMADGALRRSRARSFVIAYEEDAVFAGAFGGQEGFVGAGEQGVGGRTVPGIGR